MSRVGFVTEPLIVHSETVTYTQDEIISEYNYLDSKVSGNVVSEVSKALTFKTSKKVPKTGILVVGWGGNNGSTLTGALLAHKHNLSWETSQGHKHPDYLGSICFSTSLKIGVNQDMHPVYCGLKDLVPMLDPKHLEIGGWDISRANLAQAVARSKVLSWEIQEKLTHHLSELEPLPSPYFPEWMPNPLPERADNLLQGTKQEILEEIRRNIRDFKTSKELEKVIVVWSANTEKNSSNYSNVNDTAQALLNAISQNRQEISVSNIFGVASVLENCIYINGSPHNIPKGLYELAETNGVPLIGDDFKSGQTKIASVMVDFLINSGLRLMSLVSYNGLGNNDTHSLSQPDTGTRELMKSQVLKSPVRDNPLIYQDLNPDHCAVMKFVPYLGDEKHTMFEFVSEIFMGGHNTIFLESNAEDSLLTAPVILDLVILAELFTRVQVKTPESQFASLHYQLGILGYLLKNSVSGEPGYSHFGQRQAILNLIRALVGLPPESFTLLEHKVTNLYT